MLCGVKLTSHLAPCVRWSLRACIPPQVQAKTGMQSLLVDMGAIQKEVQQKVAPKVGQPLTCCRHMKHMHFKPCTWGMSPASGSASKTAPVGQHFHLRLSLVPTYRQHVRTAHGAAIICGQKSRCHAACHAGRSHVQASGLLLELLSSVLCRAHWPSPAVPLLVLLLLLALLPLRPRPASAPPGPACQALTRLPTPIRSRHPRW
jgi:hypothetical protein